MKKKLEQIIEAENASKTTPHPDHTNPPQHPKTHSGMPHDDRGQSKHGDIKSKIWTPTNENHKGHKI